MAYLYAIREIVPYNNYNIFLSFMKAMKSPIGGGQQGQHGIIPGSPGCRSNISQVSPGSGTLEVAPRSRWDVST